MPIKILFIFYGLFIVNAMGADFEPYDAYLDIEDNERIQAFNTAGIHYSTCEKMINSKGVVSCKDNVGVLTNKIKIKVVQDNISDFYIDESNKVHPEKYAKVYFEYTNAIGEQIKSFGFIPTGRIRRLSTEGRVMPIYSSAKNKPVESCPPKVPPVSSNVENNSKEIIQSPADDYFSLINSYTDELSSVIGKCSESKPKTDQPYDELLLEKLPAKTKNFSHQEIVQIDSLARTLYGEMQGCYRFGLHYPMALARIAMNRAEEIKKNPKKESQFIKGEHHSKKPNLAKIVTSPSQFKVWTVDSTLKQIMCPPSSPTKYWKKNTIPSNEDLSIWSNTLKIAIEAIKFPDTFKTRTGEDFNILFYTSNRDRFFDMIKVEKRMLNRDFKDQCLNFWAENPKSKIKEKKDSDKKNSAKKKSV